MNEKIKIGDYVTAKLVGKIDNCQGVFIKDNGNGTITVRGEGTDYICDAGAQLIADKDICLPTTQQYVSDVRKQLGL